MSLSVGPNKINVVFVGRFLDIHPSIAASWLIKAKERLDAKVTNPNSTAVVELAFTTQDFQATGREVLEAGVPLWAGTVTTPQRLEIARQVGTEVAVLPHWSKDLIEQANGYGMPIVSAVSNRDELTPMVEAYLRYTGKQPDLVKVYPAAIKDRSPKGLLDELTRTYGDEITRQIQKGREIRAAKDGDKEELIIHTPTELATRLFTDSDPIYIGELHGGEGIKTLKEVAEAGEPLGLQFYNLSANGGVETPATMVELNNNHGVRNFGLGGPFGRSHPGLFQAVKAGDFILANSLLDEWASAMNDLK